MMLNDTDNSTDAKRLQAIDTTRKAGGPGESEGCMEGAFFRGKGKRSSKQEGCNEWDESCNESRQEKGQQVA